MRVTLSTECAVIVRNMWVTMGVVRTAKELGTTIHTLDNAVGSYGVKPEIRDELENRIRAYVS